MTITTCCKLQKKCNLKLNYDKLQFKQNKVEFFGETYTTSGHKPSKDKVAAITSLPSPTNKKQVQSFIGMVNYLPKLSPRLSELAEPTRELYKDKVPFNWGLEHQAAFIQMKKEIASAPILAYYNPKKHTTLQTDASIKGIGACLLQDAKSVYFATRDLTNSQKGYVVTEWDLLQWLRQWRHSIIFYMPVIFYLKLTRNHLKSYYLKVLIKLHQDCREYL